MKTQSKTHKLRRFLCGLTAMATAALMVPMAATAGQNSDGPYSESGVTVDKGATNLVNDQTRVTLEVSAGSSDAQKRTGSNVVFVLDKSTSVDVRESAGKMLDELLTRVTAGNTVNVAVVSFESSASTILNWTELSADNIESIKNAINTKKDESGTNIQLGLQAGVNLLSEVQSGEKYLVLVTDGITYQWGNGMTIYSESASNGEESINAGNDMLEKHHPNDYAAFVGEFANISTWYAKYGAVIQADITQYEHEYVGGQVKADVTGNMFDSTYVNSGFNEGDYIPGEELANHYSANEAAVYMAVTEWKDIISSGINAYAYADVTSPNAGNAATYPWASNFVSSLSTIGGTSDKVSDSNVDGIFDDIEDEILNYTDYTIASGTVTDYISRYFNLTSIDSVDIQVNGQSVTLITRDNYTLEGVLNNKSYKVTYNPSTESFDWELPTVAQGEVVTLSYDLTLDRTAVEADSNLDLSRIPTNTSATLDFKSTDGTDHSVNFPIPYLFLENSGDEEPVIPSNPSLTIRKIWENDDISTRPSSITVDIYRDGLYIDSIELYERYGWRDSYEISERYEDADWWVVESDVPSYYDSDVEEVRDNVFYITNTYEEPVIETPVTSEPESSEPSSEPSEVTPSGPSEEPSGPSGPSVEPSTPSSEPSSESAQPAQPAEPTLPQTGQLWWPVPALLACGALMVAVGAFKHKRGNSRHER